MSAMFVNQSGQNEQSLEDPSIDASYQVSVHLAEGRFKCERLMDDRQWTLFLVMEVGAHRSTYHD